MPAPVGLTTCTRVFTFDSGHRVLGHEGRCKHLHGHTYRAEVVCAAKEVTDTLGRVIDFSVIKEKVGSWIDANLDHNFLCHPADPIVSATINGDLGVSVVHGRSPFLMPEAYPNPTAENIARLILERGITLLAHYGVSVVYVRLWETPNCFAEYYNPLWMTHKSASRSMFPQVSDE